MSKPRILNKVTRALIFVPIALLAFFSTSVKAEGITVTGAEDLFFEFEELQTFTVRTFAWEFGIDSQLWLYKGDELLVANDDYFGLDSYISVVVEPGYIYRLRTSVCCGNPDRWYGSSYIVETSVSPIEQPSDSTVPETTTTVPETTTTVEETTTTTTEPEPEPTTTTVPVEETVPEPPVVPETTTTIVTVAPIEETPETTSPRPVATQPPVVEEPVPPIEEEEPVIEEPVIEEPVFQEPVVELTPTEEIPQPANNASYEEKKAFEKEVNIYSGEYEDYVPAGSTITVAQRRVVVAVTAVAFMMPAPVTRRKI